MLDLSARVGCTQVMSVFDTHVKCQRDRLTVTKKLLKQMARQRCVGANSSGSA